MRILVVDDMETRRAQFKKWYAVNHDLTMCVDAHEAFRVLLEEKEPFDVAFLDHDLADEHYNGYAASSEPTGYDLCKFIVTELPPELRPRNAVVHSWNPDGAMRMVELLRENGINVVRKLFQPGPVLVAL